MGKEGMSLAVVASIAMAIVAFCIERTVPPVADTGICCLSPDIWGLSRFWGWMLNLILLLIAMGTLSWLNKEYRIVNGTDMVITGMFMLMASSNVWVSGILTSSLFVAIFNMVCLGVLFGCYRQANATREIFVIGTILAIGSMFEYSLLFMAPVYLIGAIILKCFSFKSLIAFFMGIGAPYWIGIGFGWLPIDGFKVPDLTHVFADSVDKGELLVGMLNICLTVVLGLFLGFSNSTRLYAGSSRRRVFNLVIDLLGAVCLICLIFDFKNLTAYLGTIYMVAAIQLGNFFGLSNVYRSELWLGLLSGVYIAGFVLMLVL